MYKSTIQSTLAAIWRDGVQYTVQTLANKILWLLLRYYKQFFTNHTDN